MVDTTFYDAGTASVANGATAVTISGVNLTNIVFAGDQLFDPAQPLVPGQRITTDADSDGFTLAVGWPGTSMVADAYEVRFKPDNIRGSERTRQLLEQMSVVKANGSGRFYKFATATVDADPAAGYLRLNHATIASATGAYIDDLDANGGAFGAVMDTWDDSTSVIKGQLWLMGIANKATFHAFNVTGSVVDGTGYRKVTLTYIGGSGSFAADEEFMLATTRTGDQGAGYEYDAEAADASGLTAHEGEAVGFKVWLDDLGTDFGAYSGRGGVVRLIAGPDWEVAAVYTGPQGEQGIQGDTGEKGDTGSTGTPGGGLKGIACRAVATSNVDIATALENADTVDGVTLDSGDVVLLTAQTAPAENGVYVVSVTGAAARHTDFDAYDEIAGGLFPVSEGTSGAGTVWHCTSATGGTVGVDGLVFEQSGDPMLTALADLTTSAGQIVRFSGADSPVAQDIVGTVSESGGVPTGAIIERGSGANGRYVRFADGTQICEYDTGSRSVALTTAYGSLFRSAQRTVTWQAVFIADPSVYVGIKASGGGINLVGEPKGSTTGATYYLFNAVSFTGDAQEIVYGIGRWF